MASDPDLFDECLNHLPLRKRRELKFISKILFEEFERAQTARMRKKYGEGRILKIILFGSHARGDWVEDRIGGYLSDFDILVIVDEEAFAAPEFWHRAQDRLLREVMVTNRIKTPVQPIIHSLGDVNRQLTVGRPFFLDILRDGIMLYGAESCPLAKPGNMTAAQKLEEAQKYFDEWYELSLSALELAKISYSKSKKDMDASMRDSAFLAHQATERIYICLLLTLKLYSPKSHNLKNLHSLAVGVAPELKGFWPESKQLYKRAFERLYDAYVKARYSPHYEITTEELEWLFTKIENLQNRVKIICQLFLDK